MPLDATEQENSQKYKVVPVLYSCALYFQTFLTVYPTRRLHWAHGKTGGFFAEALSNIPLASGYSKPRLRSRETLTGDQDETWAPTREN